MTTKRRPLPHWHAYNESHLADFGRHYHARQRHGQWWLHHANDHEAAHGMRWGRVVASGKAADPIAAMLAAEDAMAAHARNTAPPRGEG